ncbi:fibronectin-binding protein RevA (plasmid) [Borreliella yangtzensis]|uniref:fibronectin-binding protein RevA n=1 Tax=Borreliella yangtzensis TaxID=683292 RepID=UPI003BA2A962
MEIKNIVKLFCISILFVMACSLYVEEKKEIDSILAEISAIDNKTDVEKFKGYKDKINELKEKFKDVSNAELKEKLSKLQSLFRDKLADKLAALKAAKQKIEGISETDNGKAKMSIWAESKLVGVTIAFKGSYTTGKGKEMSNDAVSQIDKIINFLEEGTN